MASGLLESKYVSKYMPALMSLADLHRSMFHFCFWLGNVTFQCWNTLAHYAGVAGLRKEGS